MMQLFRDWLNSIRRETQERVALAETYREIREGIREGVGLKELPALEWEKDKKGGK